MQDTEDVSSTLHETPLNFMHREWRWIVPEIVLDTWFMLQTTMAYGAI